MKLSQFTVVIPHYPTPNHYLLFHTLSRAMIAVDKAGWDMLQNLPTTTQTDHPSGAFLSSLKALGFLVPKGLHEGERYESVLRQNAFHPGGEIQVTLLTNLQRCPLACGYCYQKGTHTGGRLEGELEEACLSFIKGQCLKLAVERLFISYYGSEPLSNLKAILSTATSLQSFCRDKGMDFRFGMVTSGVLLTRRVVSKLLPLGFVMAQMTIDGNQKTHDASRPFQNGKGTYARIMKNLEAYAGLIATTVLCVVDDSRVDAAYELIDTLAEKGYALRRVRVMFSPVMPTPETALLSAAPFTVDDGQLVRAEKKILVEIAKLQIDAAEKGFCDDLRPKHTWCAMQRHDGRHFTLEPSGKIYTCPTFIGRDPQYEAGQIHTGIGGIDTLLKTQYTRSEKCRSCRYLPICADCRADALHRTGDITAANSFEESYDLLQKELIKAHYQLTQRRVKERAE
jgi:uncharacterized protein